MRLSAFGLALGLLLSCQAAAPQIDKAKMLGNAAAPMTLEIYSSYDCPHCKIMHETELPLLMKDFVIPGKACIVSREFPLSGPGHPYAREAANYATAAARINKFEAVADVLFKNQGIWALNGRVWDTVASVLSPAEQAKVQALAKDPSVVAEVQRDLDAGIAGGITSTPSTIIVYKGRRFPAVAHAQSYELFKQYLDQVLAH
ncbi:MAG TPA: thioredoxin domain-containing protein [Candidatus Sulfopaludibacter sp.]|jgi:protein-disulfide isomerase|nr:thioredoxin domain-containing protein [Candidatus Sulfopaludibacter sp.]